MQEHCVQPPALQLEMVEASQAGTCAAAVR